MVRGETICLTIQTSLARRYRYFANSSISFWRGRGIRTARGIVKLKGPLLSQASLIPTLQGDTGAVHFTTVVLFYRGQPAHP